MCSIIRRSSTLFFLLLSLSSQAQFRLPPFDVEIKGGASAFVDFQLEDVGENVYWDYVGIPLVQGGINFHFSQHFALGAFATRSLGGSVRNEYDGRTLGKYNAGYQLYGINARASAGRRVGFRPFLTASYFAFQMYMDYGGYRVANDTKGFGFSAGAMIRVSNKLYLVFPEVAIRQRFEGFFFEHGSDNPTTQLEAKAGLQYNFSKRK